MQIPDLFLPLFRGREQEQVWIAAHTQRIQLSPKEILKPQEVVQMLSEPTLFHKTIERKGVLIIFDRVFWDPCELCSPGWDCSADRGL